MMTSSQTELDCAPRYEHWYQQQNQLSSMPGTWHRPDAPRRRLDPIQARRLITVSVGLVAAGLVPWMAYLSFTLPRRYEARDWSLLWIGYDVFECLAFASFAWLAWRRQPLMLVMAVVAGTLMVGDAWFDVVTSWGSQGSWFTLVTAIFVELPLAAFMYWLSYRTVVRSHVAFTWSA